MSTPDHESEIAAARRALRKAAAKDRPEARVDALLELGALYGERSHQGKDAQDLLRAIRCLEEALDIPGGFADSTDRAFALGNLGIAYANRASGSRTEDQEKALELFQEALELHRREDFPEEWAAWMLNLGNLYTKRRSGDPAENLERALGAYREALETVSREEDPETWAILQLNRGTAYLERWLGAPEDNLERASRCLEQALEVFQQLGSSWDQARSWTQLGHVYSELDGGNKPAQNRAIDAYRRALRFVDSRSNPRLWAEVTTLLGVAHGERAGGTRQDDLDAAIQCFERVLEVEDPTERPADWAATTLNLARTYADRSRHARADTEDECQAVNLTRSVLDHLEPTELRELYRFAACQLLEIAFDAGRWGEAVFGFTHARPSAEHLYESSLLRSGRQVQLASEPDLFRYGAYALARVGRVEEAVSALETGRARAWRERVELDAIAATNPEARAAIQELKRLRRRENRLVSDRGYLQPDLLADDATLHQLFRLARRVRTRLSETLRPNPKEPAFPHDDLLAVTEPTRPLVYLCSTTRGSLALVVSCPNARTSRIRIDPLWLDDLDEAALDGWTERWPRDPMSHHLLEKLGSSLLAPLARKLQEVGASSVLLIPTGTLGLLPLHAAPLAPSREDCLLDELEITYAVSARVQASAQAATRERERASTHWLGVGAPSPASRSPSCARAELEAIRTMFDASVTVLEGHEARVNEFQTQLLRATHLHLACHATFDVQAPLRSGLELAGNDRYAIRDLLGQASLPHLHLVVLSACDTGQYEAQRLPDEVLGLPAAWLAAGATGVVSTLWRVDDVSTALLMETFYLHLLTGAAPGEALRQAVLWLRDTTVEDLRRYLEDRKDQSSELPDRLELTLALLPSDSTHRPYRHPRFWAPFTFSGV